MSDSLSKFMINYETFINALICNSSAEVLKNKLSEILKKKENLCKRQKLDYQESLNSLIKLKEIVKREKIWNMFKNYDIVMKINLYFRLIMEYYMLLMFKNV